MFACVTIGLMLAAFVGAQIYGLAEMFTGVDEDEAA